MKNKYFNRNKGIIHIVAIVVVLVIIAVALVGFNKFGNKFLASPTCTTTEQLATLKANKADLEKQLVLLNTDLSNNNFTTTSLQASLVTKNSDITKTTALIYSDATIAQYKLAMDNTAKIFQKGGGPAAKSKAIAAQKVYQSAIASNTANNALLVTLNAEKAKIEADIVANDKTYVTLNADISKLQTEVATLKTTIISAEENICPLCEKTEQDSNGDCIKDTVFIGSACTDKNDNEQDGKIDCDDSDCSSDSACKTIVIVGGGRWRGSM